MIYLLSEMMLALAVAVVLGIALGWVIHRSTHARRTDQIKQALVRKSAQLGQAKSDIAMLTDDYDELHIKSQEQIDTLREENRQIPSLSTNLEKSQLLVRQMMQRHEAKLRDLSSENQKLTSRLTKVDRQQQVTDEVSTKLDEHKRRGSSATDIKTATAASTLAAAKSLASGSLNDTVHEAKTSRFAAAESDDDPFDKVIEVADEMQLDLDQTADPKPTAVTRIRPQNNAADPREIDDPDTVFELGENEESLNSDAVFELSHVDESSESDIAIKLGEIDESAELDATTEHNDSMTSTVELDDTSGMADATADETIVDEQQMDAFISARKHFADTYETAESQNELPLDGSSDSSRLFESVEQQDDLQQIFGIGPLTEKALNDLGITSYSQLADLKQHDIQRIADALEIGQGRIERDNWVGNARRQLEEVLEQL